MALIRDIDLEDEGEPSHMEIRVRKFLSLSYRFAFGVFFSFHTFDFLFNPIWMHGYLWSLNQPIDIDLSDKAAGVIVEHQLKKCEVGERFIGAILSVLAVILVLKTAGYGQRNHSVWNLFLLSSLVGIVAGSIRCMQQAQRLLSVFHESFYIYFHFFVVSLCMTIRTSERLTTPKDDNIPKNQTSGIVAAVEGETKKTT